MDYYDDYNMMAIPRTDPFPHTEVRTLRPDAEPYDLADDLLNWLAWNYVEPHKWYWIFRGVRKQPYRLISSLDRRLESREQFGTAHSRSTVDRQTAEAYLLKQFKKAAHHFIGASMVPDNTLEWLALMQHYGAPTRLLDFTRSCYVACFFALEENTDCCAIWAVDTNWLLENSFRRISKDFPKDTQDILLNSQFMAEKFDKLFVMNQHISLVVPIVPPRSNPRLLVQQGLFLCPSIVEGGIERNLMSYNDDTQNMDKHVFKIIVDGHIRTEVLSELRLMNISRASLFPELEGYASSLCHELEYRSADELKRSR